MARMITGIDRALADSGLPGLEIPACEELNIALEQALGPLGSAKLEACELIKPRVFRLRFEVASQVRSVVAKRMEPQHARRNELVIRRWLPELGFSGATPELLGLAADEPGRWVWHVYEDLEYSGAFELPNRDPDPAQLAAVVRTIADLHSRFAAHPVLAECRLHGENYGREHFASNVRDAIHALERLRPPHLSPTAEQAGLRDRLLERLRSLLADAGKRAVTLTAWGGAETLLHGDLWTTNTFVEPASGGTRVRFIDWDRLGVGPASYDISTFLLRFAPEARPGILKLYREAIEADGERMPADPELNLVFETAELARYANRVIWPALALLRDQVAWGFDELAAVEEWFIALGPVLPEPA
jgi:aminoglycoside phosphotransferase (APT) family kinase protein